MRFLRTGYRTYDITEWDGMGWGGMREFTIGMRVICCFEASGFGLIYPLLFIAEGGIMKC